MSIEEILRRQEEQARIEEEEEIEEAEAVEEGEEDSLAKYLKELEEEFGDQEEEEPKEILVNRQPGSGRGNSYIFTVFSSTDAKGNRLNIRRDSEASKPTTLLSKKQEKERRKYERKKEKKRIQELTKEVKDL